MVFFKNNYEVIILNGLENTKYLCLLNDIDLETYLAIINSLDKIERELFKSSSLYC